MITFTKTQDKTNPYDHCQITFTVDSPSSFDIVEEFYHFMLGAGFSPEGLPEVFLEALTQITGKEYVEVTDPDRDVSQDDKE